MTPWTFDVKFPHDTQLTFGSLTFTIGEDEDLKMLPLRLAPEHLALASSSASGGSCSGLDPCAGIYIRTARIIKSIPVVTSTLRSLVGASSLFLSAPTPNTDLSDDYSEIGANAYGEPAEGSHLICMVASNGDWSHNNSNKYPTIGRSVASDARTSSVGLVQNLNLDFNVVRVQAIMETI
jgi:hypothetical protein